MVRRKTHEEFIEEVFKLTGDEYKVLSEYEGNKHHVLMKHNINECNHEWFISPTSFLGTRNKKGSRCAKCFGSHKRTTEQFKQEVYSLVEDEYLVMNEYKSNNKNIVLKHNIKDCGYEWTTAPIRFLNGVRCLKCFGNPIKSTEEFKNEVYSLVGNDFLVLGEYVNAHTKILIAHNTPTCNYKRKMTPQSFLNGTRCSKCSQKIKSTTQDFKEKVKAIDNNEYRVLGEYKDANSHILMKHEINECGHEWLVPPSQFLRKGSRCPNCSSSKGEKSIINYLFTICADYKVQHRMPKSRFKFDVILFENVLIEYDGQQHFYPVDFSNKGFVYAEKQFAKGLQRDKIKNQYCIDNNFPLIRIPYWEFKNIESILENTLIHFGLIESNPSYDNSKVLEYLVNENWNHDEYLAKCPKNIKEQKSVCILS